VLRPVTAHELRVLPDLNGREVKRITLDQGFLAAIERERVVERARHDAGSGLEPAFVVEARVDTGQLVAQRPMPSVALEQSVPERCHRVNIRGARATDHAL